MHYWVRASPADFAGAIPQPRSGHTAVNIGKSQVVVFGGLIDKKFLSDITVYDIENKLWFQPECTGSGSDGQVGPSPRAFHVAVATDCHMFIFGGRSGGRRLGDFWVLDTDIWQWSELTSFGDLPSARDFAAASAIGNSKIVMFGGWDGKKWLSDVYILDTSTVFDMTLEWKELAVLGTIPPPRCGHTATMVDKRLLVYGGKGGGGSIMDDLWALKGLIEEENESPGWTQLKIPGRAPTARCGHTVTSGGLHPLLFGGHGTGDCLSQYDVYYNDCVVLDRVSVQWKRLVTTNESPVARAYHSMTSIGSRYLLFGGFDGKSTYGDLWWLVPEDFQVPIREDLIMERLQEEARKISEYAVSHQKEVDKIVIYEQFFIELLQNKPQENIGIKIIGHLSDDLFLSCTGKHDVAKELHNEFQELILDVNWDPFQVVEVEDGVSIYQLSSQKNERLERLGEYGEEGAAIVDVIIATKRELMEYNSSGCYKIPKIWNFDDFRVATASECCDFTRQWLRVQAIKARRYDDRLIRDLLHTYLKLEVDSSHTVHMFLCEGILGARTTKSLIDPLYRAIVEGTAEPKAAITKHQRYFRCLSLEDRNAFASGLLTSLEERVFLGDCTSNIEICDVLRLFTREDMLSYEIIEDYLDQIDHPQFLASVEFFLKKM